MTACPTCGREATHIVVIDDGSHNKQIRGPWCESHAHTACEARRPFDDDGTITIRLAEVNP